MTSQRSQQFDQGGNVTTEPQFDQGGNATTRPPLAQGSTTETNKEKSLLLELIKKVQSSQRAHPPLD